MNEFKNLKIFEWKNSFFFFFVFTHFCIWNNVHIFVLNFNSYQIYQYTSYIFKFDIPENKKEQIQMNFTHFRLIFVLRIYLRCIFHIRNDTHFSLDKNQY